MCVYVCVCIYIYIYNKPILTVKECAVNKILLCVRSVCT